MTGKRVFALATTAVMALASPASAKMLKFELTGRYSGSWILDTRPAVDFFEEGQLFRIHNVPGTFSFSGSPVDLVFYNKVNQAGGIGIEPVVTGNYFVADGDQLYTGPESAPTFHPGRYTVNDPGFSYNVDISGVPEPATWAMMIAGFGLLGGVMRKANASGTLTQRYRR